MKFVKMPLRIIFDFTENFLGRFFSSSWNPMLNLGALGFFFYWIITVSGIYVYIFFDTGVNNAYESIEYMTHEQWYLAGIMRSLHRYASDGLVVVMLVHLLREFALDRYRGVRWFSWVTGVPVLVMVFIAGITGYWMVWDKLAQYVAIVSTEWLDMLPIFGEPIARNFLSPDAIESRFFTLMVFMHIAIPLIALAVLWMHLQRVTKAKINPPRGLAYAVFGSLMVLSIVHPAVSQGKANLAEVPGDVGLDWFYLPLFPLLENLPGTLTWSMSGAFLLIMIAIPWLPPMKKAKVAKIDLDNCNGCARCYNDCPYNAIQLVARTDGKPFEREPIVNPDFCVACGICAGACPTSMPFRRLSDLSPGIDLPDRPIDKLRADTETVAKKLKGPNRILVYGCDFGAKYANHRDESVGFVSLTCIGQLPPAFIDYVISRDFADGVLLTGCSEGSCHSRWGDRWMDQRLAGERDPHLRNRVPRERVKTVWAGKLFSYRLKQGIAEFAKELEEAPPYERRREKKVSNGDEKPQTIEGGVDA